MSSGSIMSFEGVGFREGISHESTVLLSVFCCLWSSKCFSLVYLLLSPVECDIVVPRSCVAMVVTDSPGSFSPLAVSPDGGGEKDRPVLLLRELP